MVINELSFLRYRRSPQVPERRPCPNARPAIAGLLVATFRRRRTLPSEGKGRRYGALAGTYTYIMFMIMNPQLEESSTSTEAAGFMPQKRVYLIHHHHPDSRRLPSRGNTRLAAAFALKTAVAA